MGKGKRMKKKNFNDDQYSWIQVSHEDDQSISELRELYHLSYKQLGYALDRNERARVEFNKEDASFLLIFNVPLQKKQDNHFKTSPVTFILKENYLFSFASADTQYAIEMMEETLTQQGEQTPTGFLMSSLFQIAGIYFPLTEEVNEDRIRLNKKLREKTTNKALLELSDLEVGLIYLVTAAKQNAVSLEQVKALDIYEKMSVLEKELLEDALIEVKQAVEMTQVAFQVMNQLSGTYNNLLNNNLNDTMKLLTVWSLLLTVPTLVTSFFGMNVPLPFSDTVFAWGIIIVISFIFSIWLLLILWRRIQ